MVYVIPQDLIIGYGEVGRSLGKVIGSHDFITHGTAWVHTSGYKRVPIVTGKLI